VLTLLITLSFAVNGLQKSLPLPLATADWNIGTVPMTLDAIPTVPLQLAPMP
jgi:hypothetical protein